ncbi:uncharacterized protein PODANS_5_9905 [Podospora anserina S mat+]|uniref:Podospora anserina S mat+ genomic DNA chromosome 5, supercontig 9 n=1 Tax=Podospora anserina (strain S / ATCC MYA-4624 / DSM 980 / FGSC 10383) TaxID=515849 RepID=B2AL86_PODAN|nr:uncharacterized protein PODANS_5_9905 [Podospora anserina S mat+]CAP64724.1 unnamed protein product [Podospora anserina S mat+]CDP30122.1 Putative protein of unknown function [Podospora anserina S mat+]
MRASLQAYSTATMGNCTWTIGSCFHPFSSCSDHLFFPCFTPGNLLPRSLSMADPLSVIGSAAGVASLGIQGCQGLMAYFQAIGERKHQIKDDLRNLQNLQSLFMVITDVLPQLQQNHSSEYAVVKKCLFDCEDHLVRMQGLLSTIDKSYPGDSLKGKLFRKVSTL